MGERRRLAKTGGRGTKFEAGVGDLIELMMTTKGVTGAKFGLVGKRKHGGFFTGWSGLVFSL